MPEMAPIPATKSVTFLEELRAVAALSWPLALTNLAQIAMGTTDVMMMGRLGPDTLAAGTLGTNLYLVALIFGIGLLNVVTPMIARERGRGSSTVRDLRKIVQQGFWSARCIAIPCWLVLWWSEPLLIAVGQDAALSAAAGTYVHALQWALLPSWCYLVLRSGRFTGLCFERSGALACRWQRRSVLK